MKSTKVAAWSVLGAAFFLVTISSLVRANDDPAGRAARFSYIQGTVSFRPAGSGDNDWVTADPNHPMMTGDRAWADTDGRAELRVGSTAIRLDHSTGIIFLNLANNIVEAELATGSMIVRLRELAPTESFEVDAPNLTFSLTRPGDYRIDVDANNNVTVVTVHEGEAQVTGGGSSYKVSANQQATFTGTDTLNYALAAINATQPTDFDRWATSRDNRADHPNSTPNVFPRQFEDAVITPNTSGPPRVDANRFTYSPGGRFTATNVTLVDIIVSGVYQTRRIQMRGGPDWIDSERFDIDAKADVTGGSIKQEEWHPMIQALLEDRFKLALHRETREMSVYALVPGKNPRELPQAKGGEQTTFTRGADGRMTFQGMSIKGLVNTLSNILREPVVDATGIEGFFDFTLDPNAGGDGRRRIPPESYPDSVLSAMREQLGFDLEKRKAPLEITVIDHAERPSEDTNSEVRD